MTPTATADAIGTVIGHLAYHGQLLTLRRSAYDSTGNLAVLVLDQHHEPFATLSVNFPGAFLPADCFWLKDWSENQDLASALIESGLVEPAEELGQVDNGYVTAQAYRLRPQEAHA